MSCIACTISTSQGILAELGNIPRIYLHEKEMAVAMVITFLKATNLKHFKCFGCW